MTAPAGLYPLEAAVLVSIQAEPCTVGELSMRFPDRKRAALRAALGKLRHQGYIYSTRVGRPGFGKGGPVCVYSAVEPTREAA